MFFFFSKILEFFIYPLTWVLALLIIALITKKQPLRRKLLMTTLAVLLIFSNTFLLDQFAEHWDVKPVPLKNPKPYSCAIVLGGFASGGEGVAYFNGNADRFIESLKLFTTGKVSHILISGGNGSLHPDDFEEADWVKKQLKEFNVPDSCILVENRSRNTLENAAFTKPILAQNHLQPPYILVTSAFHMRRSVGIFKKINVDVIPYPCAYLAGKGGTSLSDFVPDGGVFATWNIYIKEVIGTAVNHL